MMKFLNLLIGVYVLYYTINILLDLARLKRNTSTNTKSQPIEFAINAATPPQKLYGGTAVEGNDIQFAGDMHSPVYTFGESQDPVASTPSTATSIGEEKENRFYWERAEPMSEDAELPATIQSELKLEIISESVEVTEEQLDLYAVAY